MSDRDIEAADAFGVLSDESRVAILRELADRTHVADESAVEFADLRRAVDFDDAGRFNYHLGKLQDRFVVKRDGGYAPTAVGLKAIGSIEAGTYTADLEPRTGTLDYDCPACGEQLTGAYENQMVSVECDNKDNAWVKTSVPPATAAGSTIQEIISFVVGDLQRDVEAMADGVCPICSGRMDDLRFERGDDVLSACSACQNCWMSAELPVGALVVRHPAVVSLYFDHGVDVRRQFLTDLEFVGARSGAELVAEDPAIAELSIVVEDDEVTLRLHEDFTVEQR
jgi:ssDNA-binding Zn-finger/Zn-ribbon topoisomerase 1